MSAALRRLLGALHARGLHAAVLAGLVMMPAVAGLGWLTDRAAREGAGGAGVTGLRGTLDAGTPAP
ncbi:MAG: hypothetical protein INR63_30225 [Actinomycetospora chiangmaiensis]|nr:hypothetical protein [Actinomycetospora chiangmaiensis]